MPQFDFNSFSGQTLWTLTFFVIFYFVGLYFYIPFLSEGIKLKNMVLNKNSIKDFLYIMVGIFVGILVGIGYLDIYKADRAQKLALKDYEASNALLKSKLTELESAIESLTKGGSDNPFVSSTIPSSSPLTEDVFVSSIVLGFILFGLIIIATVGTQNTYVKQFIKSMTSSSTGTCTNDRDFLDKNLDKHRQLAAHYFNFLVDKFICVKTAIFESTSNSVVDSPLCGAMHAHIGALAQFRNLLVELGEEYSFQLHGQNFGALMKETGVLLDLVVQHLAVLGVKNGEVYYLVSLMQDAQINFVIATTIIG